MFHIGGNKYFRLGRADKLDINKALESLPKGSYVSDLPEENLVTGQIGMNFVTYNNRVPTLGEMIKFSRMSTATKESLSANSTNMLLSGRNGRLGYTNEYMPNFNNQTLVG